MIRLYLREWREFRNLTQAQVSERAGMAVAILAHIESGSKVWNSEHLEELALALDVDDPRKLLFSPS